jgi:hypothetical protein
MDYSYLDLFFTQYKINYELSDDNFLQTGFLNNNKLLQQFNDIKTIKLFDQNGVRNNI